MNVGLSRDEALSQAVRGAFSDLNLEVVDTLAKLSSERRFQMVAELADFARSSYATQVRTAHPDASTDEVTAMVDLLNRLEIPYAVAIRERLHEARPQSFNVIDPRGGWKADCYLLRDEDFDRSAFERRRPLPFAAAVEAQLWVYAPEDVILYKLLYYKMSNGISVKHLRDIPGMPINIDRSSQTLDRGYMSHWAGRLSVLRV